MACFKRCESDNDFARVSLFILDHKQDVHPSFTALDTVEMLYSYITNGHILYITDEENRIIGASAYYLGTQEQEFKDQEVVYVDLIVFDRNRRAAGRLFAQGLGFLCNEIISMHPEARELRLAALSENTYLCRLYGKFARFSHTREGQLGEETVFAEKISAFKAVLEKYSVI